MSNQEEYDVALSFAGENRQYVENVAQELEKNGINVFYDKFKEVELLGENLIELLGKVYSKKSAYVVMFISKHYAEKIWTRHECHAALEKAISTPRAYILPFRFDDTEIPGLTSATGYISAIEKQPKEVAEIIIKKITNKTKASPSKIYNNSFSASEIPPAPELATVKIHVKSMLGENIIGADVVAIAQNNTIINGKTDSNSIVELKIPTKRIYDFFISHHEYPAITKKNIEINTSSIEFEIEKSSEIGSIVCINGTGYIPGLQGRLNPILDSINRMYLYATNISINNGKLQPVDFSLGEELNLEDCMGVYKKVSILEMKGNTALLQFTK